jgi:antitoxin PrlF
MSTVTRFTTKHQTTVPLEVRRVLGLEAGDRVEFRVEGTTVTLRKAERELTDNLVFRLVQTHAMRDWDTPEDDEAFRDFWALSAARGFSAARDLLAECEALHKANTPTWLDCGR